MCFDASWTRHCTAAAFVAIAALVAATTSTAEQVKCKDQNVVVEAASRRDAFDSCRGARNATQFLASHGLMVPATMNVRVMAAMPPGVPPSAIGAYSITDGRILILSYAAFKKRNHPFKIPFDQSLYQAITSHEIAHAIAFQNFKEQPSALGLEYIAYVTFFTTLKPAQRVKILDNYPYDAAWQSYAVILYLGDPLEFGAHAYQHFLQQENGHSFFLKILSGEAFDFSP